MQKASDVKFGIVHFDGGTQSITALLGGHLDAVVTTGRPVFPNSLPPKPKMKRSVLTADSIPLISILARF